LQRAVGRGLTKFVGREREMEALKHAAGMASEGRGQIVAAMAEPGVGKSRLFFEFKATSQSGWMVLETFSVSHGKASAYLPVIDLLRNYFKIVSEDDERTRREKVAGKIAILDRSLEDTLPYLFALLGIVEGDDPLAQMDGQVKKRRTLEAIKRIVLRESLNQPLVLIFEDLHWIDEETQSLLNLLVESIGNAKVLLLVNYRPEYTHQWNSKTYYTQLNLDPLGQESAAEMLSALLGDGKDLTPLKRLIIERTEGTPFFMEEMVQALFEDGVLQRNGIVKLSKSIKEVKVPATVQAILASRIDNLRAPEKELLQALAVIGKEFSLGIVKRTVRTSADELDRMLGNLQLREFIYEQPALGDVEYSFKHALTQEVAYNALLVERRKPLHERAGQALESLFAEQLDDHLDELAHHYSHSANSAKAVQYLEAAAQQSTRRSAYPEAISLATSGLDMSKALPESEERDRHEINLQMTLGQCRFVMDGWAAQRSGQAYQRALELCRRIGESGLAATALLGLQQFYLGRGELRKSHELDEELLALAHSTGNDGLLYEAMYLSGLTLYHTGDFVAAWRNHEWVGKAESPREISAGLSEHPSVGCQAYLSVELWHLGYPDQAAAAVEEALRRAREESHPFSLAFAMMFAVLLRILRREADLAVNTGEALVAMASEHEIGSFVMYGRMYLGWALSMQGHADKGIAAIRESVEASRAMSAGLAVPSMLIASAEIKARLGETAAALTVADDAIAQIGRNGEFSSESDAYRLKGELLLMQGAPDRAGAERCFAKALDVAHTQRAKSLELRAIMSLARLLAKQGRPAEARAMLAEIYGWFTEGFDTADLKDAKSLLEELGA